MEKPIIFSTPMIQAILEGRKTMTRRIIKPPFEIHANGFITKPDKHGRFSPYRCHYGEPGDILWVRETWLNAFGTYKGGAGIDYSKSHYLYKADHPEVEYKNCWRPSIFMPRKAARIFLKVKDVRVERLQDITEEDAKAEGIKDPYDYQEPEYYDQPHMRGLEINKSAFAGLWDRINAKRGYGWDMNPWVWVIEFERTKAVGA